MCICRGRNCKRTRVDFCPRLERNSVGTSIYLPLKCWGWDVERMSLMWEDGCQKSKGMQKEDQGGPLRWLDEEGKTHQTAKQPWFFFFSLTTTCCGGPCWYCICSFSTSKVSLDLFVSFLPSFFWACLSLSWPCCPFLLSSAGPSDETKGPGTAVGGKRK